MKDIDIKSWARREHFRFFNEMDYPQFNICANVDITAFSTFLKENGLPFFASALYLSARAVNAVPEFRYRIREGKVIEHEKVDPAITVLGKEGIFGYCTIGFHPEAETFLAEAAAVIAEAKENPTIVEDTTRDDVIFFTSIPWISFTSLTHPIHLTPVDSIPRISWGKYYRAEGRLLLPYSVQVHHALADGLHVGRHFQLFQELLDRPERVLASL